MTESKYHKRTKEFILKYGREYPQKYIDCFLGSKNPILIHHPKKRKFHSIQYEPDIYFIRRNRNKIIFEILDTEIKNSAEIISDIIQSCLCTNTDFLFFIISIKSEDEENRIFDMFDVLRDTLINLKVDKRMMPKLGIYYILKKESVSYKRVKEIFKDISKKDRW